MSSPNHHEQLGVVTEGSFSAGLTVRLDNPDVEDLQVGSFVVLEGEHHRYFSLVGDLQLRLTDPNVAADPPTDSSFVQESLRGIQSYAAAVVRPSLMLENAADHLNGQGPRAVRTIPTHFSCMRRARDEDFDSVFGEESDERFAIGSPIAMEHVMVPIDLPTLIERSNGIFGQTGTGKSVLARLLLFGLIKSNLASSLIFDMHDEYAEGDPNRPTIPGLRDFFDSTQIKVYDLDDRPGSQFQIRVGLNQIEPEDIALLEDELDLRGTFDATAYALHKEYGNEWLVRLLEMEGEDSKEFAARSGAHQGAVDGLRRKLRYLESRPYIVRSSSSDPVKAIVEHLESGQHVIVQFGRQSQLRDYMLVANLLTRRIHRRYSDRRIAADGAGISSVKPLVVVVEEAHKFLSPAAARQSIFGTIAREMRKFGVSLLVVDQRPSGIDQEVLSQLGTRITGLLTDPADIDAVLSGTGDRSALRAMLASLEPSRQCLVVGHAIPMSMILHTREYGLDLKGLVKDRDAANERFGVLFGGRRARSG